MVANLLFIFLNSSTDMISEAGILSKVGEKLLDGFISVIILLVVLWFAKKFFEKFFDIFIDNVNDNREEYQATLKVKEEQILSIINSKEAIVKSVTESYKETSKQIVTEHTKQFEILVNDSRIDRENNREHSKTQEKELINSYSKVTGLMEKFQDIVSSVLQDQRKFQENEREVLGRMMLEMEQRIGKKLDSL